MRFLLLLVVVVAAGAFLYPPWAESAPGPCAAFEKRARALLAEAGGPAAQRALERVAAGEAVETFVRARFPGLPVPLACTAAYWMTVQDPGLLLRVRP